MKKFGMLIVMLIFAGTPFVKAQQQITAPSQPMQKMAPVREYIQKNVLPVIKQERAKLIAVLTPAEKKELAGIQEKLGTFRQGYMRTGPGMRGNFNRPMMGNHRPQMFDLMTRVKKIVDAHPKAAEAYKSAIEAEKAKWMKDIAVIRAKNNQGYGRGMNYNNGSHFIFDRLSNPAFALLFNGKHFPMEERSGMVRGMRPGMGYGNFQPGRMNGPMAMGMRCPYGRMGMNMEYRSQWMGRGQGHYRGYGNFRGYGRHMKYRHPGMMLKAMNPEVKKEMLAYAQKNIFPALNKERDAFDKVLKSSEKRDIENARKNITGIKAQMKKQWQEMKKGQGQRPSDSARLAMRLELEKNTLVVREIALRHYSELSATLNDLKQYLPEWKEGIRHILFQNMRKNGFRHPMGRPGFGRMMHQRGGMMRFHRKRGMMTSGVHFLLYDPAHPGEHLFPVSK